MSDFKDMLIRRLDEGCDYTTAYEQTREALADSVDLERKRRRELFRCSPCECGGECEECNG